MQNIYKFPDWTYKYNLINIQDISYKNFISSKIAEEIILAILCNYENVDASEIIRQILKNIIKFAPDKNKIAKYIKQLRILAQLRNLRNIIEKEESKMSLASFTIDVKKDPYYKKGAKAAIEKKETELVMRCYSKFNFSVDKIADLLDVKKDLVSKILKEKGLLKT